MKHIKLSSPRKNREKGFYLLMTNGNTYSNMRNEFFIEDEMLNILKKNNINFLELILRGK